MRGDVARVDADAERGEGTDVHKMQGQDMEPLQMWSGQLENQKGLQGF